MDVVYVHTCEVSHMTQPPNGIVATCGLGILGLKRDKIASTFCKLDLDMIQSRLFKGIVIVRLISKLPKFYLFLIFFHALLLKVACPTNNWVLRALTNRHL